MVQALQATPGYPGPGRNTTSRCVAPFFPAVPRQDPEDEEWVRPQLLLQGANEQYQSDSIKFVEV